MKSPDKLFIPIENLDLISRFGFSKNNVQLDKLGLQNWQNRKAILKNRVKEIAKDLIKIAAKRDVRIPITRVVAKPFIGPVPKV